MASNPHITIPVDIKKHRYGEILCQCLLRHRVKGMLDINCNMFVKRGFVKQSLQ